MPTQTYTEDELKELLAKERQAGRDEACEYVRKGLEDIAPEIDWNNEGAVLIDELLVDARSNHM